MKSLIYSCCLIGMALSHCTQASEADIIRTILDKYDQLNIIFIHTLPKLTLDDARALSDTYLLNMKNIDALILDYRNKKGEFLNLPQVKANQIFIAYISHIKATIQKVADIIEYYLEGFNKQSMQSNLTEINQKWQSGKMPERERLFEQQKHKMRKYIRSLQIPQ